MVVSSWWRPHGVFVVAVFMVALWCFVVSPLWLSPRWPHGVFVVSVLVVSSWRHLHDGVPMVSLWCFMVVSSWWHPHGVIVVVPPSWCHPRGAPFVVSSLWWPLHGCPFVVVLWCPCGILVSSSWRPPRGVLLVVVPSWCLRGGPVVVSSFLLFFSRQPLAGRARRRRTRPRRTPLSRVAHGSPEVASPWLPSSTPGTRRGGGRPLPAPPGAK